MKSFKKEEIVDIISIKFIESVIISVVIFLSGFLTIPFVMSKYECTLTKYQAIDASIDFFFVRFMYIFIILVVSELILLKSLKKWK